MEIINKIATNLKDNIIDIPEKICKKYITATEKDIDDLDDNDSGIYIINCDLNNVSVDIDIIDVVDKEREKLKEFKISKINKNNWDLSNKKSVCLYVGSSKEIKKRLNQHLFAEGNKYKTTFSLKLNKLNKKNFFENIKIKLLLFRIEDYELVKYFEAKLWDELKPLFGQKCNK